MGSYVPNTPAQQQEMLKSIGYDSFDALFSHIPGAVRLKDGLALDSGRSELEVLQIMEGMAAKNKTYRQIFRGAGAYHHYIPAAVTSIVNKEEFVTAYTPYQAEISQGILQSIFEYQTMICQLTGMAAANASVYDGASAAAEGCAMCRERKRQVIYVSETAHPDVISVIKTYAFGSDCPVVMIPAKDGVTDTLELTTLLGETSACVYIQQPNYHGIIEDADTIATITHSAGAKLIMGCNPISMAILKTPAEYGADIAVGEGQPLGMSMAFGGPYLGFMATTEKMTRKLPGRIVGETVDSAGERAFVLTLQAREQHIRREKAGSNICSNEALCALTAAVYLSVMGPAGLTDVAKQCTSKAHYLQVALSEAGLNLAYDQPFFHEFVTTSGAYSHMIVSALGDRGILGGLPISDHEILWCTTEMNSKAAMDEVVAIVKEVCGK